ncbi:MAG TPA: hypothetical protein PLR99_16800 [Polyangiaceae bacterium]|nr:hypothetical protein [Polyangiaceae bacterium]
MTVLAGFAVAALAGCRGCGNEVTSAPEAATEPSPPAIGLTATPTRRTMVELVKSFDAGDRVEAGSGATSH